VAQEECEDHDDFEELLEETRREWSKRNSVELPGSKSKRFKYEECETDDEQTLSESQSSTNESQEFWNPGP
jgi:hypothetical protein